MNLGYQTQLGSTCIRFLFFWDCRYSHAPMSIDPKVEMSFYFLLLTFQAQLPHYPMPLHYHLYSLSWNPSHSIFLFLAYKSFQFTTSLFLEKMCCFSSWTYIFFTCTYWELQRCLIFLLKGTLWGKKKNLYCCLPCYSLVLLIVTKQEKSGFKQCYFFYICRFETNVVNKSVCQVRAYNFFVPLILNWDQLNQATCCLLSLTFLHQTPWLFTNGSAYPSFIII